MQEIEQYKATIRQLRRLQASTDGLHRRLVINGRSNKHCEAVRNASAMIGAVADGLERDQNGN